MAEYTDAQVAVLAAVEWGDGRRSNLAGVLRDAEEIRKWLIGR